MGPALGPNPNTPAISMERRQGMPSPTGKVASEESSCPECGSNLHEDELDHTLSCTNCGWGEDTQKKSALDKPEETGKVVGPEAPVVHKLPRAAATKRYSIIEPEEELDEPDESESEPESEST
jgi:hypothetical protein